MTYDDPRIYKVAAVECMSSLMFHTRYFFKRRYGKSFVVGEHHQKICDALERVLRGECRRLIINIAPRYGKTELAVKNLISHGLSLNPAAKFIHLSYSDTLALDNSEDIKDLVTSAEYQKLFPDVQLKKDSKAKKKWYTTAGGGVYATSTGGQVTGMGAGEVDKEEFDLLKPDDDDFNEFFDNISNKQEFAGALIIDDAIKPDDAFSDTKRERINLRYDSTIRNRTNSRNTPIVIIGQRVHEYDLCGYVQDLEPGEWEVLSLPSIKDDGTALWPHKHTIEELNKEWLVNAIVFESQHLQRPKPREGLLYKKLKTYEVVPTGVKQRKAVVDTADTGDDFLCSLVYDRLETGYYLVDVIYTEKGMEVTEEETATQFSKHAVEKAKIESNNGGRGFARNVEKICRLQKNFRTEFDWYHQTQNKEVRIFTNAAQVQNMIYFPANWAILWPAFYKAVTGYLAKGKNKHDDGPDALTMIIEAETKPKRQGSVGVPR